MRFLHKIIKPVFFLHDIYKIYKIIQKVDPDIIHINNGGYPGALSCSAAVFSARLCGKNKVVYVVNNIAVPVNSLQRSLLYPIDLFLRYNVSRFVTASSRAKESLKNVLNLSENQIVQIPNTIVPRQVMIERKDFRKKYGIAEKDILIGCVALFEYRKGHHYLLNAFSNLLRDYKGKRRIFLMLDGKGEKTDEIKAQISELGIGKCVIMTNQANIYDLYNAIDFLVLPSIEQEDFPNVVIEAMYMKKPVIGTDVGGIPEQIKNGYNGFVVEPKDVEGLEESMLMLITKPKYARTLGINGKKIFRDKFSEKAIVSRYMDLYNVLMRE